MGVLQFHIIACLEDVAIGNGDYRIEADGKIIND